MKRELTCTWTFWQDQWQQGMAANKQYLAHLGDALNIKDFYVLLNRHTLVTVPLQSSLHIFRKHVRPEWEDQHNINGGHLRIFAHTQPNESPDIAKKRIACLWFDVLRSVIGEHLDHASSVVGVGYTSKPRHPILSIWLSTTDPTVTSAIRDAALNLFAAVPQSMTPSSLFTTRFYPHKNLASDGIGFRTGEVSWHRRSHSAPENHVTIGDEEEDTDSTMGIVPSSSVWNHTSLQQTNSNSESMNNSQSGSTTSLQSRRGLNLPSPPIRDHQRSKTTSSTAEAIAAQPIKPIGAPSPVKDWTTAFTPSYMVNSPSPLQFPPPQQPVAVPQPPKGLDVFTPPSNAQQRVIPPQPTASVAAPTVPAAASVPKEGDKSALTKDGDKSGVVSDRPPFVYGGLVYPPKMNRKVYRAVVFNQNPEGTPVDGTFPAPPGAEDGNISMEQYEKWLAAK